MKKIAQDDLKVNEKISQLEMTFRQSSAALKEKLVQEVQQSIKPLKDKSEVLNKILDQALDTQNQFENRISKLESSSGQTEI